MPYIPGLDGLRALAVVAVMVYHANHEWLSGGFLGVEVFFVISGYLITLLMIGEHERLGRIHLGQFWKRRFRRLLPALFVMMGALALYLAIAYRRPQGRTRGDFLGGIFYGSNWYQIVVGQSYTASEAFAPLRHLWSLAVEEQFYLLWPLIMVLILRRGRERLPRTGLWLAAASAAIAVAVAVLFVGGDVADECGTGPTHGYATIFGRCININDTLYLSTFTRAGGLMLGASLAMLWRPGALMRGPMRNKARILDAFAVLAVVGLAALIFKLSISGSGDAFGSRYNPWLFRGGFFLTGLATLTVIAATVHRRSLIGRLLGNRLLNWIGTRSYGLYLYHWPIYQIIRKMAGVPLTLRQFLLAMAITVPITEISYRLIETPIRLGRLGRWLRGEQRIRSGTARRTRRRAVVMVAALSAAIGFAGVSLAVARNFCVGDVECSIERAQSAAAAGPVSGPVVGPAVVTTAPPTRLPPRLPDTTDAPQSTTQPSSSETTTTAGAGAGGGDVSTTSIDPTAPTAETVIIDPTSTTAVIAGPPVVTETSAATTAPATTVPTTDASAPAGTDASGDTTAPTESSAPAPVTVPGAPGIQPVALGESVMLGAITDLQAGGFFVDALKSRQGDDMATLVETMRANNQLGAVVVIQIGTNGSVSDVDFQRIMAQLPPDLTPTVVFLTVRVPKKWQDGNNLLIHSLADRYTNVTVLDWQVASMFTSLCSDGIHIACGGGAAQFYANLIFDAIGRPDLDR
jgi:peptidoglycan/LPS O-acetylase OafA/YrhL